MNFNPTNADPAVPIVIAEGRALPRDADDARNGLAMRFTPLGENTQLRDAACWKFVLNGARENLPDGLEGPSEILTAMFNPADMEDRQVRGAHREILIPPRCQPERVVASRDTAGHLRAGTQLITEARQTELRDAYFRALQDPLTGEVRGHSTLVHRTERQQEFHYLLMKTIIQLYGFVTISRERAAVTHNTLARQWLTVVVRCSTWWGWDHWGFKGTSVSKLHQTTSRYAQTVPGTSAFVGGAAFWDEHLPETRVYISKMPQHVLAQLRDLRSA